MAEHFIPYGPDLAPKLDRRSELLKAKEKFAGLPVVACPFGCKEKDLDEQEYCQHLVGTSRPGEPDIFEPLKPRAEKDGKPSRFRFTDGTDPQVVDDETDVRVPISEAAGHRIYRRGANQPAVARRVPAPQPAKVS